MLRYYDREPSQRQVEKHGRPHAETLRNEQVDRRQEGLVWGIGAVVVGVVITIAERGSDPELVKNIAKPFIFQGAVRHGLYLYRNQRGNAAATEIADSTQEDLLRLLRAEDIDAEVQAIVEERTGLTGDEYLEQHDQDEE